MIASELRKKTVEQLQQELLALLKEQFNLRVQKGNGQAVKSHLLKINRHSIARIKTLLKEKEGSIV